MIQSLLSRNLNRRPRFICHHPSCESTLTAKLSTSSSYPGNSRRGSPSRSARPSTWRDSRRSAQLERFNCALYIQDGPSGRGLGFVDIAISVVLYYKTLILWPNFKLVSTNCVPRTKWTTLYCTVHSYYTLDHSDDHIHDLISEARRKSGFPVTKNNASCTYSVCQTRMKWGNVPPHI